MEKYYKDTKPVNTLPPRAYFIPFSQEDEKSYSREDSSRFISLCGSWKIRAYDSVTDADEFWKGEGENSIPVPSCVQFFGYDYMQYTNMLYPFSYNPPHVPAKNPAFHYSRRFDWKGEKAYLVFEGVDSCFYVYLNGSFVGYSNISHRISEFDVSSFVRERDNKLDVLVLKWNMGSYLEDQDKWRLTGIFRDVYLLSRPEKHISDFSVLTKTDGTVTVALKSDIGAVIAFNGEKKTVGSGGEVSFKVEKPSLWSAETPCLYDMAISANGEVIYHRVGICQSEVKDGVYLFNGKPIKLHGVNRHDFHPEKGCAVSYGDMKRDILLMKSLNVNALRTSHYPSSPLLYELCNEYGIYVMSESDLETHGCCVNGESGDYHRDISILADSPLFTQSILERQVCNYEEHKNFSCVNIYSMGNESGWGGNFEAALALWKKMTDKPIHYEGLWEYGMAGEWDNYYKAPLDMVSRMYCTPRFMKEEYLKDEREKRPLVLCEYMHAMANSGGIADYWDAIESSDRFMGGYIWEWADHAVRTEKDKLCYGGDFGEFMHDGNFCIDGIVSADRQIKSATLAMKRAYQPIKFTKKKGKLLAFNNNFFKTEAGTLAVNGEKTEVCISPRTEVAIPCKGDAVVKFYSDAEETSTAQFISEKNADVSAQLITPEFTQNGHRLKVKIPKGEIVLDKDTGEAEDVIIGGKSFGAIRFNVWRAPTDNDRNVMRDWDAHYLRYAKSEAESVKTADGKVKFDILLTVSGYSPIAKAEVEYSFTRCGLLVQIKYALTDKKYFAYLPRIGLKMTPGKEFNRLKYRAYGPSESYSDSYLHTVKAEYEGSVEKEYFRYLKPQESGSHFLPDYASLTDGKHTVTASGMQSFSALCYSAETLADISHDDMLPAGDNTYFCLDFCMSGMGSNACGPLPEEKYCVPRRGEGKILIEINEND